MNYNLCLLCHHAGSDRQPGKRKKEEGGTGKINTNNMKVGREGEIQQEKKVTAKHHLSRLSINAYHAFSNWIHFQLNQFTPAKLKLKHIHEKKDSDSIWFQIEFGAASCSVFAVLNRTASRGTYNLSLLRAGTHTHTYTYSILVPLKHAWRSHSIMISVG